MSNMNNLKAKYEALHQEVKGFPARIEYSGRGWWRIINLNNPAAVSVCIRTSALEQKISALEARK